MVSVICCLWSCGTSRSWPQQLHHHMQTTQAILRKLRHVLKAGGKYEGSKLALMDHYHVKLSELSSWAFVVSLSVDKEPATHSAKHVKASPHPKKAAAAPKKAVVPPKKVPDNRHAPPKATGGSIRPQRTKRKVHDNGDMVYY